MSVMNNPVAVAALCHEANRFFCRMIGDVSQPSWNDAPQWQVESAVNGAVFHLKNPDAGPESSHENWMAVKVADGWKYGPEKDEAKKEHPCMVPYAELPEEQRVKDALFIGIVDALRPLMPTPE